MNKVKRELLRIGMQAAVRYQQFLPGSLSAHLKTIWNQNQYELACRLYPGGRSLPYTADLPPDIRILDLSCTSGFGECVHPCVRYIPGGAGKSGWRYIMALTPLPRGIEYFENPEFLVSSDGENWHIPQGGRSPLIAPPSAWVGYNSDPFLHCENGKVFLIYRRTEYVGNGATVQLLLTETADCVNWSHPSVIMTEFHDRGDLAVIMSPAVIKREREYLLWYVNGKDGVFSLMRAAGGSLDSWGGAVPAEIRGLPPDTEPWHIDITERNAGELIMTLCWQHAGNYRSGRGIAFASSADGGVVWNVTGGVFEAGKYSFCKKSLYKGSLIRDENGIYKLYFSGQGEDDRWFTAVKTADLQQQRS